jgi:hypothetical protein
MSGIERVEAPSATREVANTATANLHRDAYTPGSSDKPASTSPSSSQNHLPDLLISEGIKSQQSSIAHDSKGETVTTTLTQYPAGLGETSQETVTTAHLDGSSLERATIYKGKTPTSMTDWIKSANENSPSIAVSRDPLTGQAKEVDNFSNHTEVTFDPKTGKPNSVNTMFPEGGSTRETLVYLDPSTGKATSERVWSASGVESDYSIDAKSGALIPTKLKPLSWGVGQ